MYLLSRSTLFSYFFSKREGEYTSPPSSVSGSTPLLIIGIGRAEGKDNSSVSNEDHARPAFDRDVAWRGRPDHPGRGRLFPGTVRRSCRKSVQVTGWETVFEPPPPLSKRKLQPKMFGDLPKGNIREYGNKIILGDEWKWKKSWRNLIDSTRFFVSLRTKRDENIKLRYFNKDAFSEENRKILEIIFLLQPSN